MNRLSDRFQLREEKTRKSYIIDESLYNKLVEYEQVYDASVGDIVNYAIECFLKVDRITISQIDEVPNKFLLAYKIKASNIEGLKNLKAKYGISVNKLVNMAIRTLVEENP